MTRKNTPFRIEMLLLSILKQKDCYGYELSKSITEITDGYIQIKEGTMYPILYSLLDHKFIESYDEIVKKKVRIYYHINDNGLEHLHQLITEYRNAVTVINQVLETH